MNKNKIIQMLLEHDDDIKWLKENVVTKKDHEQVITLLDEIKGIVKKNDEEVVFMGSRVERIEKTAEQNKQDNSQIKPLVGLA